MSFINLLTQPLNIHIDSVGHNSTRSQTDFYQSSSQAFNPLRAVLNQFIQLGLY